jgi:Putative Flp pilus-assembly TadE/G-like
MRRPTNDGGQAVPLLLVVLGLAVAAALLVGEVGVAAARRAHAQTAADAAALAGALSVAVPAAAEAEARRVATDNGAVVESFAVGGATVTVTVRLGGARASASAEASPVAGALSPPGGGDRSGLAPALLAALARADALLGRPVAVVGGRGLEVEVSPDAVSGLLSVGSDAGLCSLPPPTHPIHFTTCPPTSPA